MSRNTERIDGQGAVVAFAGRRIDAIGASPARFPAGQVDEVRRRIRHALTELRALALVSSAACGADLLALDEAGKLGIPRVIVLPFDRAKFRDTSVTDRGDVGEHWAWLFDRLLSDAPPSVITLEGGGDGPAAYAEANARILAEAEARGAEAGCQVIAVIVWDGVSRGPGDLTEAFAILARARGLEVWEILTR